MIGIKIPDMLKAFIAAIITTLIILSVGYLAMIGYVAIVKPQIFFNTIPYTIIIIVTSVVLYTIIYYMRES